MKYYYPLFRISFKKEKERKTISTACKDVMLMGMWSASDTLESNWHILRKWNTQIPLLLVYPREVESDVFGNLYVNIYTVWFMITKNWKQPRCVRKASKVQYSKY